MKFSAISTVYNEGDNIKKFLESVLKQTRLPDEFVIVDGGSTDNTVKIMKEFAKKHKWLKVYVQKCNIAEGRNIAISKAKHEIIVGVDAGCRMDKNNFKNIVKPFEKGYEFVGGAWEPTYKNIKQEAMARVLFPNLDRMITSKRFTPSSRNIAFKKSCWGKIGGYPEHLYTGEDTLFNLNLMDAGCKYYLAKNTMVYWEMRKNYKLFWKQFFLYGLGDRQAGNLWNFRLNGMLNLAMILGFWGILAGSIGLVFVRWWYGLALFGIIPLYFILNGLKMFFKTGKIGLFFHGMWALMLKRVGYIFGATFGKGKGKKVY